MNTAVLEQMPTLVLTEKIQTQVNFAITAEKIGTKAAFALKFLQEKSASYTELNEYLYSVNHDFGSRLTGTYRQVLSWKNLDLVEVVIEQGKSDTVSITAFGSNVLSEIKEKHPEKLMTPEELKTLHAEAKALEEVS